MFDELLDRRVKIAYKDGDRTKVVYGTFIGEDEHFLKICFRNGRTIGIGKSSLIRITEDDKGLR